MAEAARTVRHYVSDCLQERHPYDARKAFTGRPERDAGLVYRGFQPDSTDIWIESLSDPSVGDAQRVRALRLLIAHSASQEAKIMLLRKGGILPAVVAALNSMTSIDFECQAFNLMRSVCVLSQGCRSVMDEGGLEAVIRSIHDCSQPEKRADARCAAVMVLYQISFNMAGVRWLLGMDAPPGFELLDAPPTSCVCTTSTADVIAALVFVVQHDAKTNPYMQRYAVASLSQLTTLTEGIFASIRGNAVSTAAELLHEYASDISWLGVNEIEKMHLVTQLLILMWNVSMEQSGVDILDESSTPDDLFRLFVALCKQPIDSVSSLLRALSGALSSVYKLLSVKMQSMEPLDGEQRPRIQVVYEFLRRINDVVGAAKHEEKEPHPDVIAISINVVLCTRFASEVKAVRDFTHAYLDEMERNDRRTEAFYFRRQLYYQTKWEEEFKAHV